MRRRPSRLSAVAMAMVVLAASIIAVAPSTGAEPTPAAPTVTPGSLPANCTPTTTAGRTWVTCTFGYTGANQRWTVPEGVRSVKVRARGGQGGDGTGNDPGGAPGYGGPGGTVVADVQVASGQSFDITVGGRGGRGHEGGAWPDGGPGGAGGSQDRTGCGGGGRTSFLPAAANWLLIAAGGGGCGGKAAGKHGVPGGAGGDPGQGSPLAAYQSSGACEARGLSGHGADASGPGHAGAMGRYLKGTGCPTGDTPRLSGNGRGFWEGRAGGQGGDAQGDRAGGGGGGGGGYYGGGGGGGGNDSPSYGGGGGGGGGQNFVSSIPEITNVQSQTGTRDGTPTGAGEVQVTYEVQASSLRLATAPKNGATYSAGSPASALVAVLTDGWNVPSGAMTLSVDAQPGCTLAVVANEPSGNPPQGRAYGTCDFTPVHAGSLPVTASYAGNAGVAPSSQTTTITVEKMPTSVTLAPSTDGPSLTATITGNGSGVAFDGQVDVTADGSALPLCTGLPVIDNADGTATASCDVVRAAGSTIDYVATYRDGTDTARSVSAPFRDEVANAATTTEVALESATLSFGETAAVTVSVSTLDGMTAPVDGTVEVTATRDDGSPVTVCAAVPVDESGTARCSWSPGAGSYAIDATFSGGTRTDGSASSTPATLTVARATPAVVLTADPAGGSIAGQRVVLRGAVTAAGGTVPSTTATFHDDGIPIPGCTDVTVVTGSAECALVPSIGDHTFTVTTSATADLTAGAAELSGASPIYHVGLRASTTTIAMSSPNPAPATLTAGTPVTATATVTADGGVVTGTVAFNDNGQPVPGCDARPLASGVARCTWTPSPGGTHQVNAAFAGNASTAASATPSALVFDVGRHASTTSLDATVDAASVTLRAAVSANGPTPGGTITFTDAGVPIASCGTPAGPTATCTLRATGGAHSYRAVFSGDQGTAPSTSDPVPVTIAASSTAITATARQGPADTVVVTTTVDVPGEPTARPSGSVTVTGGGSTCSAALTPTSGGGSTASCSVTVDPTVATRFDVAYLPSDPGAFTPVSSSVDYTPVRNCPAGVAALVATLTQGSAVTVSAGNLGTVSLTANGAVGPCDGATAIEVTVDANLFNGTLTAGGVTGSITPDGFCVQSGRFALPTDWHAPAIEVATPICFSLAANGTIEGIDSGGLTGSFAAGSFLFMDLPDVPATAMTVDFTTDGGVTTFHAGLVAGPAADPVVVFDLTVATDGSFSGVLTTPGLTVLGQSLAGLSVAISGGGGRPLRFDGQITLGPITIAPGLTLTTVTVTVTEQGFGIAGTTEVGVAGHTVELAVAGSIDDGRNWSLTLSTAGVPVWEPVSGLAIRPDFSGTIASVDGNVTWTVTAGGAGLATWKPAPGATITIDSATLGTTTTDCPAVPAGTDDLVLAFTGSLALDGVTVATSGCVDLTIGTFHLDAASSSVAVTPGLALTDVVLTVDAAVSGAFTVVGSATATVSAGGRTFTLSVAFDFASDGTLVIGGSVDLTPWGAPVRGYVAYASSSVRGFDTRDPSVGRNGRVDLAAGLTAVAVWTPSPGTAEVLAKAGFTLGAGGTVDLVAMLSPGRTVSFHANLTAPRGMPMLALPGGVTVTSASLDFTAGVLRLVVDGTVAMPGGAPAATAHLDITIDGSTFSGSATVRGLVVFGQTVDLRGAISGTRGGGGLRIDASIQGRIPGPISLPGATAVTLSDLTLGLDGAGITVSGAVDLAGRAGMTITGTLTSVTDWTLSVTSTARSWTPAPGLTITAAIRGHITRTAAGVTFEVAATGSGPGLARFTPVDGFGVTVHEIRLGNGPGVPRGCSVSRAGDVWLYVNGSATLRLASVSGGATAAGCFDLTSGAMGITADASAMSVSLLGGRVTLAGPTVTVSRDAAGYAVDASVVFGVALPTGPTFTQTATLSLRSGGVFVVGVRTNLSNWLGSAGGNAYLYYSSAAIRGFDTGDPSFGRVDLVSGITFAVKLALPTNVARQLATMGLASPGAATVTAVGTADFAASTYTLAVRFDAGLAGQRLFTTASGVSLSLDSGYLKLTVRGGSVSFGLGLDATLHTPSADRSGPGSDVGLTGEITISTTELKVGLRLGDCRSGTGWQDAFGVRGLTVQCAALQGGVALAGPPLPTFGLMGTITSLPDDVADAIGFVNGAPISFAFNLDPFLLSIAVGTLDSDRVASRPLAMYGAPDAMQVYYATLYISPTGATIGEQTYPAGIGFAFQASLGGVSVSVLAKVDLSVPKVEFDGRVAAITVGPLTIGPAAVHFEVSPRTFAFTFDGALALGPAEIDLGAVRVGGSLSAQVHLGVAPAEIAAWLEAQVSAYVSAYLPHAACYFEGYVPYPCDWWWEATHFDYTLQRTGFTLNSGGLTLTFNGYSLTLPFDGSRPGVSEVAAGGSTPSPTPAVRHDTDAPPVIRAVGRPPPNEVVSA